MKKIIAILLAAALLAGMCLTALAEEAPAEDVESVEADSEAEETPEDDDGEAEGDAEVQPEEEAGEVDPEIAELAGAWYGEIYGMPLTLTLTVQGVYNFSIDSKSGNRSGRWELEDDLVFLDRDAENRVILHRIDEALEADIEGIAVTLTRERPEASDAPSLKGDVVMADFEGRWTCTRVSLDGMTVEAAPEGKKSPLEMNIAGETIVIASMDEDAAPVTTQATYANGVMTLGLGAAEGNDGPVLSCLLQALSDGTLRMDVGLGAGFGTMTYFLERAPEPTPTPEPTATPAPAATAEPEEGTEPGEETEPDEPSEPETTDAAEEESAELPEPTEAPALASTPEGLITSIIESRVKSKFSFTEIDGVTIEPDGESYTADVHLTWSQQSPEDTSKTVLSKFSADLAAYVGQRCPNVSAITVNWTVPYLDNAGAALQYSRGADGMEEGASNWDSAF